MVGLVIASHGRLAEVFVQTARDIVGDMPQVATCSVQPGVGPEEVQRLIRQAVREVDRGDGVLVMADLLGGTPCTQSLCVCGATENALEVVTGVNLPMVIKANSLRTSAPSVRALAAELTQYGQRHITCATEALRAVPAQPRA